MHFIKATTVLLGLAHRAFSACIELVDTVQPAPQTPMVADKTVTPSIVSQLSGSTVIYNVTFSKISVYNGQPASMSSALLTFSFPSEAKGKQCTFGLYLDRWAQVCPSGSAPSWGKCSGTFALYSSFGVAKPNTGSPNRKDWIGVLQAEAANNAKWVQPSSNPVKIPCPTGDVGFELVPQSDFDFIYFPLSPGAKSVVGFTYS